MNKNYSTTKMNVYIALTIAAMLPSLGLGISFIKGLLDDISYHLSFESITAAARDKVILSDMFEVASWLIPLLLGCIAASFLLRRRKIIPGFILGIILISVSYWYLIVQAERGVAECLKTPQQPDCEFAGLIYLVYVVLWGANVAALTGFVVLVNQIQMRRGSNMQPEDKLNMKK